MTAEPWPLAAAWGTTLTLGSCVAHPAGEWTETRRYGFGDLARAFQAPEIGAKDGRCYVPATFRGTHRRKDQAVRIDVAVLDSDAGADLATIRAAIEAQGWHGIIHSTHSHLTTQTAVAAQPARDWLAKHPGASVADYMAAAKGTLPSVTAGAEIVAEVPRGRGLDLIIRHAPCPGNSSILLPLAKPWLAENYPTQTRANAAWKERIEALPTRSSWTTTKAARTLRGCSSSPAWRRWTRSTNMKLSAVPTAISGPCRACRCWPERCRRMFRPGLFKLTL